MCTFGEHTINTGDATPIASTNHRVPIYWEDKIDDKIKKLFEKGIFRSSRKPRCSKRILI